jgi:hypothetical protein
MGISSSILGNTKMFSGNELKGGEMIWKGGMRRVKSGRESECGFWVLC